MKRLSILLLLLFTAIHAQTLSADDILNELKTAADTLQDARFVVTGELNGLSDSPTPLELNVSVVPGVKAAKVEFIQPTELADNFIVMNGEDVYNYVYLTNQVTIFSADDPEALGGLFPEGNSDQGFDFTFNPEQLFRGWSASVEGYRETPEGGVYDMRFVNEEPAASVTYAEASIVAELWYPLSITFYGLEDETLLALNIEDFERDQGLDPEDITYIPDNAEVIDER